MRDHLDDVHALLPGARLRLVDALPSGSRADVLRVHCTTEDGAEQDLVVKRFSAAGEGWVRESAALAVLPPGSRAPRLVAAGAEPPVIVMTDLGEGPSVASALLGHEPEAAARAVLAWAESVAGLHVATRGAREAFRAALDEREGDLPVADSTVAAELHDAASLLDDRCGGLNVAIPGGALDELRGLGGRLGGDGGCGALSPADTCPDNNAQVAGGLGLIDFEGAQWRHVAWDVAYLRVPWPTCWCSWRLPDDVAARAIEAYRAVAGAAFPEVAQPGFGQDVEVAAAGWALISTAQFLDAAFGDDPPPPAQRPGPTRRALILHRLQQAAGCAELPAVAELAARLRADFAARWGELPLELAPAFR